MMQDDFFASSFRLNYHTRNAIVVRPGTDLAVVYDWIKSAQRDGAMGALAADNWRVILLTPGVHTVAATLILDTAYVALVGMSGNREDTRVEGNFADAVIEQTVNIIALRGFTVYQNDNTQGTPGTNAAIGFLVNVSVGNNTGSTYKNMFFDSALQNSFLGNITCPVFCNTTERGFWWDCESTDFAWRVPDGGDFGPTMYLVRAIDYSFGGDGEGSGNGIIKGTYLYCECRDKGWGGCAAFGLDIDSTALFYRCLFRDNCCASGKVCDGKYYYCEGRYRCLGGYASGAFYGTFQGYAFDTPAGDDSYGSGHANCRNTGTMIGCEVIGLSNPIYCESAKIRKCRITVTITGQHGLVLKDGGTVVYDTDIIVYQGGTGIPINDDGAARNVVAAHNRFNNQSNDADGLGPNVTNLVGTAYNAVDDQII